MVNNVQTNIALENTPYERLTEYKIGHTTYIVKTRFNFTSESLNDIISRLISVVICKGGILPPNTYYDCGSFVVNRKAVIGKEKIYITAEIQHERSCINIQNN